MTTRFMSVPLADDPELAEHALWNEEIAGDLEEMTLEWEADRPFEDLPDISEYRTPVERAEQARTELAALARHARAELARLASLSEGAAAAYRVAITGLHDSGMSYAKIGAVLGISRGTVQGHVERGRR
jgi:DNA-directed RNA polymerase specialized sigma24 family protein